MVVCPKTIAENWRLEFKKWTKICLFSLVFFDLFFNLFLKFAIKTVKIEPITTKILDVDGYKSIPARTQFLLENSKSDEELEKSNPKKQKKNNSAAKETSSSKPKPEKSSDSDDSVQSLSTPEELEGKKEQPKAAETGTRKRSFFNFMEADRKTEKNGVVLIVPQSMFKLLIYGGENGEKIKGFSTFFNIFSIFFSFLKKKTDQEMFAAAKKCLLDSPDLIIVDEAHQVLKNPKTQSSVTISSVKTRARIGFFFLFSIDF